MIGAICVFPKPQVKGRRCKMVIAEVLWSRRWRRCCGRGGAAVAEVAEILWARRCCGRVGAAGAEVLWARRCYGHGGAVVTEVLRSRRCCGRNRTARGTTTADSSDFRSHEPAYRCRRHSFAAMPANIHLFSPFSPHLYAIDAKTQLFLTANRIFGFFFEYTCAFAGISWGGASR